MPAASLRQRPSCPTGPVIGARAEGVIPAYAAVHLGAAGSRVVVGRLAGGRLRLREVHRFANRPVRVDGTLRWDVERLYGDVLMGLGAAARAFPGLASVGIHGWGADFGLLDARGRLLGAPFVSGTRSLDGAPSRLHARVPEAEIWAATGVPATASSTLVQLHAMVQRRSTMLWRAARLLLLPDLLAYWLCGEQVAEHTIAATTQCYDPERRAWAAPLLAQARIPLHLFPPLVPSGTALGPVRTRRARRAGIPGLQVVAPAALDAAAAVAAIPAVLPTFAWVQAGREWRVGAVAARADRSEGARGRGLANGGGADGAVHLHRATAGLRLVEECRRAWSREGGALDEDALWARAASGPPRQAAVDPDDPALRAAEDLPAAIRACCARDGQDVPGTRAEVLRAVLWGLARKTREIVEDLEAQLGRRLELVHLVGAGARRGLLCQLVADACARPVLAGPVEAAAMGNVLAQAFAAGGCGTWAEARALARASTAPEVYEPGGGAAWSEAGVSYREAGAALELELERSEGHRSSSGGGACVG